MKRQVKYSILLIPSQKMYLILLVHKKNIEESFTSILVGEEELNANRKIYFRVIIRLIIVELL